MFEIYSFFSWQWWAYFGWFAVAIVISWFIPGLIILNQLVISKTIKFFMAPVLGISLWAIQGYFFGWLNIRWLSYFYLISFGILFIKFFFQIWPLKLKLDLPKPVWAIFLLGMVMQLVPILGSGWRSSAGLRYYFVNIFDGLFHLSLQRSIIDHVPPFQPGAAGLLVTNYHYLADLVIAELARIWFLPLNHIYFHYLPIFMSFWLGFGLILLLKNWSDKIWTIAIGLSLFYGGGELSWLINLLLGSHSQNPFEVYIDNGILQFLNMPQAFAKLIMLGCLILLNDFWKKRTYKLAIIIGLMMGSLIGFKVYYGAAAFLGLGFAGCYILLTEFKFKFQESFKSNFNRIFQLFSELIILLLVAGTLALTIYLPNNSQAGGLFFDFLTWPKLLLGVTKLNWNEWWLRLQVYQAAGSIRNLTIWYSIAVLIFVTAIYHLRLGAFLSLFSKYRQKISIIEVCFLLPTAVIFGLIGMTFLQASGGANTFNFTVVALFFLNLLATISMGSLIKTKLSKKIIIFCLLTTLVQTGMMQYFYFKNYYFKTDSQLISPAQEAGLKYLSQTTPIQALVQTSLHHTLDFNTPYGYFFTGHQAYLGGRVILESHNQPIADRFANLSLLFRSDATSSALLAKKLNLDFLLLNKTDVSERGFVTRAAISATVSGIPGWKEVYANDDWSILTPRTILKEMP